MEAKLSAAWAAAALRVAQLARAFPTQPDAFVWVKGETPFSDERWVVFVPLLYVVGVVTLQEARAGRRPLRLGPLPALHNAILALGSAAMFAGAASEALQARPARRGSAAALTPPQASQRSGSAEWLLCLPAGTPAAGRQFWWSYVYYLSKARRLRRAWRPLTLPPPVLRAAGHGAAAAEGAAADAAARVSPRGGGVHGAPGARRRSAAAGGSLTPRSGWTARSRCRSSGCSPTRRCMW